MPRVYILKPHNELKHPRNRGSFSCVKCHKTLTYVHSLIIHRKKCLVHECLRCPNFSSNIERLAVHMREDHNLPEIVTCRCCALTFENNDYLKSHKREMKNPGTQKPTAPIATAGFDTKALHQEKNIEHGVQSLPTSSSSSSSSNQTSRAPSRLQLTNESPLIAASEEKEQYSKQVDAIIAIWLLIWNYSDEELLEPETWIKMVQEADSIIQSGNEK